MRISISLTLVVIITCAFVVQADNLPTLTVQVEPQTEECFYQELESGKTLNLNFEVVRGGLLDIQLRIYSSRNKVIYEKMTYFNKKNDDENVQDGKVSVVVPASGENKICFDNTMSRWTAKVVTFSVGEAKAAQDIAKLEHLGPVVDSVIKISEDLETIERLQHQMRVRENVHRDTAESISRRILWLSIVESLLLIGLAVFQTTYIRTWFADKDKLGRV